VEYLDRLLDRFRFARFTAKLVRAIKEAGETDELRLNPADRRILKFRDGEPVGTINLGNLYCIYRRSPSAQRPQYLRMCVRMAIARHKELPDDFEAARQHGPTRREPWT
jgi:hypothetical protein